MLQNQDEPLNRILVDIRMMLGKGKEVFQMQPCALVYPQIKKKGDGNLRYNPFGKYAVKLFYMVSNFF